MIYVTGDIHGNPERLSNENFPEQKEMSRNDYVVILGDFGLVWNKDTESRHEKHWLDWLEERPFTTLFVDGNHENFDRLNAYPEEEWQGGLVHKIRPHVIHLMRGGVFTLDAVKVFAFGGAPSHDIMGLASREELQENYAAGILDPEDPKFRKKKAMLKQENKYFYVRPFRIKGESWWPQELASEEEKEWGLANLKAHGFKVDLIFSHEAPESVVALGWGGRFKPSTQSLYLEEVRSKTKYIAWLFGHYHENRKITDKELVVYEQIVRVW